MSVDVNVIFAKRIRDSCAHFGWKFAGLSGSSIRLLAREFNRRRNDRFWVRLRSALRWNVIGNAMKREHIEHHQGWTCVEKSTMSIPSLKDSLTKSDSFLISERDIRRFPAVAASRLFCVPHLDRGIISISRVSRHVAWGQESSVCNSSVPVWPLQSEWHALLATLRPPFLVASQSLREPRPRRRRRD